MATDESAPTRDHQQPISNVPHRKLHFTFHDSITLLITAWLAWLLIKYNIYVAGLLILDKYWLQISFLYHSSSRFIHRVLHGGAAH